MPEPSLGEITSVRPEATVNPGVVNDTGSEIVRNLNQMSQFNAEMKQRRYAENLGLLKEVYSDIGQIQGQQIMEADRPVINQKLAAVFDEIGKDPRSALAGPKYADIQKKLGEVRALSTQSKQDNIYDKFHDNYLQQDADLNTPENKKVMDSYRNAPLGQRKPYVLEMPQSFDTAKASQNILNLKSVGTKYSDSDISDDNKFIVTKSGTEFNRDAYLKNWNLGFDANPRVQKWAQSTFDKVKDDPAQLGAYADPQTGEVPKNAKDLYQNAGKWSFNDGKNENIKSESPEKKVANPYEVMNQKEKVSIALEGIRTNDKIKVAAAKKSLENQPVPQNAGFLVKTYAGMIAPSGGATQTIALPGGQKVSEQPINSLDNTLLKKYMENEKTSIKTGSALGASELISSGKTPDLQTRTSEGGIRLTYFKHYKEGDKIPQGKAVGDVVTDENGSSVGETTQVIPARAIITAIAPNLISKPILGQTVETATNYINGKKLEDIDATIAPDKVEHETLHEPAKTVPSTSYSVKGKKYTHQELNKMGYSDDQINEAIKNGLIKK